MYAEKHSVTRPYSFYLLALKDIEGTKKTGER